MNKVELLALVKRVEPRRKLGQNFLIEPKVLETIAARVSGDVLEIGCGPGNLTWFLARRAERVVAVEVDAAAIEVARTVVPGARFLHDDAVRAIPKLTGAFTVVSNLPYSAYREILLALLEAPFEIRAMILTVQRDVYDKIAAKPGTKEYGALSVVCQTLCNVKRVALAPRGMFWPPPRVDSVVFELTPQRRAAGVREVERRLRRIFSFRGRKLRHALPEAPPELSDARVEALAPGVLYELAAKPPGAGAPGLPER